MNSAIDLFEDVHTLPSSVVDLVDQMQDASYIGLKIIQAQLNDLGYDFDWGLDGKPYNLHKVTYDTN